MRTMIENKLGERTYKRTGTGSLKNTVSYYCKHNKGFDWDLVQELKKDDNIIYASIDCITVKG